MTKMSIVFFLALFAFIACAEKDVSPYSIFIDSDSEIIETDLIVADLNSTYEFVVQSGYETTRPVYSLRKNNGDVLIINDSSFVMMEMTGFSGPDDLFTESTRIQLDLSQDDFSANDLLKITSSNSGLEFSKTIEVK